MRSLRMVMNGSLIVVLAITPSASALPGSGGAEDQQGVVDCPPLVGMEYHTGPAPPPVRPAVFGGEVGIYAYIPDGALQPGEAGYTEAWAIYCKLVPDTIDRPI